MRNGPFIKICWDSQNTTKIELVFTYIFKLNRQKMKFLQLLGALQNNLFAVYRYPVLLVHRQLTKILFVQQFLNVTNKQSYISVIIDSMENLSVYKMIMGISY